MAGAHKVKNCRGMLSLATTKTMRNQRGRSLAALIGPSMYHAYVAYLRDQIGGETVQNSGTCCRPNCLKQFVQMQFQVLSVDRARRRGELQLLQRASQKRLSHLRLCLSSSAFCVHFQLSFTLRTPAGTMHRRLSILIDTT